MGRLRPTDKKKKQSMTCQLCSLEGFVNEACGGVPVDGIDLCLLAAGG